jgi:hypothetical protein
MRSSVFDGGAAVARRFRAAICRSNSRFFSAAPRTSLAASSASSWTMPNAGCSSAKGLGDTPSFAGGGTRPSTMLDASLSLKLAAAMISS